MHISRHPWLTYSAWMRFALIVVVALLGACKSQGTGASKDVASCNVPSAGNCREYSAANLAAGSDHLAKLCAIATNATFSMAPCPTANSTGRCAQREHTDVYYTSYPIPAEDVEKGCTASSGRFTKGP